MTVAVAGGVEGRFGLGDTVAIRAVKVMNNGRRLGFLHKRGLVPLHFDRTAGTVGRHEFGNRFPQTIDHGLLVHSQDVTSTARADRSNMAK
jgi:hypothetical protein